jgi:hypothetical protein
VGDPPEVFDAAVPATLPTSIDLPSRGGFAPRPTRSCLALCQNDAEDPGRRAGAATMAPCAHLVRRFIAEDGRMHYLNEAGRPLPETSLAASQWLAEHSLFYAYLRYNALRLWLGAAEHSAAQRRASGAGPPPEGAIETLPPEEILRGLRSGPAFQLRYHRFLVGRSAAKRRAAISRSSSRDRLRPGPLSETARDPPVSISAPASRRDHRCLSPLDGQWSARGHRSRRMRRGMARPKDRAACLSAERLTAPVDHAARGCACHLDEAGATRRRRVRESAIVSVAAFGNDNRSDRRRSVAMRGRRAGTIENQIARTPRADPAIRDDLVRAPARRRRRDSAPLDPQRVVDRRRRQATATSRNTASAHASRAARRRRW